MPSAGTFIVGFHASDGSGDVPAIVCKLHLGSNTVDLYVFLATGPTLVTGVSQGTGLGQWQDIASCAFSDAA